MPVAWGGPSSKLARICTRTHRGGPCAVSPAATPPFSAQSSNPISLGAVLEWASDPVLVPGEKWVRVCWAVVAGMSLLEHRGTAQDKTLSVSKTLLNKLTLQLQTKLSCGLGLHWGLPDRTWGRPVAPGTAPSGLCAVNLSPFQECAPACLPTLNHAWKPNSRLGHHVEPALTPSRACSFPHGAKSILYRPHL